MTRIFASLIVALLLFPAIAFAESVDFDDFLTIGKNRLSCDFSTREDFSYIKKYIGHNPWIIDINLKDLSFDHISHAKRIDRSKTKRFEWLDKSGVYENVKIDNEILYAEKEQFNFVSRIKLNIKTGHLNEDFDIKRSNFGNPMD